MRILLIKFFQELSTYLISKCDSFFSKTKYLISKCVDSIFSKTKYLISKCYDSFPSEDQIDVMSWIFISKSLSKHIRSQIASDCREPSLEKLAESFQCYASNHNKTFGSLMFELKSKPAIVKTDEPNSSHSKSVDKKNVQCTHCKKKKNGHMETDCFIKHPEKKENQKRTKHP